MLSAWRWALAAFALAALTGSLLRFGMLHGFPFGLRFLDIRHAHSHLMYFAWVTPALMLSIATVLRQGGLHVRAGWVVACTLVVGFAAYPPFLLSGYGTLPLAGSDLPVSMIVSSINGLAWYAFAAVYVAATWGRSRTTTLRAFDAAIFLLLLASLGAVSLAVVGTAGVADPAWMAALVAFFLDLFGESWFALGVLGLAYATIPRGHAMPGGSPGLELLTAGLVVRSLAALAAPAGAPWVGAADAPAAQLSARCGHARARRRRSRPPRAGSRPPAHGSRRSRPAAARQPPAADRRVAPGAGRDLVADGRYLGQPPPRGGAAERAPADAAAGAHDLSAAPRDRPGVQDAGPCP